AYRFLQLARCGASHRSSCVLFAFITDWPSAAVISMRLIREGNYLASSNCRVRRDQIVESFGHQWFLMIWQRRNKADRKESIQYDLLRSAYMLIREASLLQISK